MARGPGGDADATPLLTVPRRQLPGRLWRRLTAPARRLPDFLVIGAQKAGTTALYGALARHPGVAPASRKEVHYFDYGWGQGELWYRSHFPVKSARDARLTGEATPYYLYHPLAPQHAASVVPRARLVAVLRDPVARAYSHYHHEVRGGWETLDFEAALAAEPERLRGVEEHIEASGEYSLNHHRYSYLDRGRYATQLERWLRFFPREQLLVVRSEDFFGEPERVLAEVAEFLGLDAGDLPEVRRENVGHYTPIDPTLRARVARLLGSDNQRLKDVVGCEFSWESA